MKYFYWFTLCALFSFCSLTSQYRIDEVIVPKVRKRTLTEKEMKTWYTLDYKKDTVPGISLNYALNLLDGREGTEVVIAVIDTELNINHPYLKDNIWTNKDEIPDNNIDDDGNGFVDDVNGWNFLGNSDGDNLIYENFEFTRLVKEYEQRVGEGISSHYSHEDYRAAKKLLDEEKTKREEYFISDSIYTLDLKKAIEKFKVIIPFDQLTIAKLDSLKQNRPELSKDIETLEWAVKYDYSIEAAEEDLKTHNKYRKYYYNLEYNEREIMGDDQYDLADDDYGNNKVAYEVDFVDHSTLVSGLIESVISPFDSSFREGSKFRIMPIVAAAYGQAHDKDLALAIRYAVDNGASIINLSIIKQFSIRKKWVFDAIKYAASKDVLIINGSGNDNLNIDENKNFYPNDNDYENGEFVDNFLMVGGSTYEIEKGFRYSNSNYGKINVDVLAPAVNMYTSSGSSDYKFVNGTSMSAPLVTGIAALIRSYFPKFKASKVKEIIINGGNNYDINVPIDSKGEKIVPFSQLTKSGKIVNAYNALILAEENIDD